MSYYMGTDRFVILTNLPDWKSTVSNLISPDPLVLDTSKSMFLPDVPSRRAHAAAPEATAVVVIGALVAEMDALAAALAKAVVNVANNTPLAASLGDEGRGEE